ncbi:MAG: hypothetical protein VX250_13465 [Planctomycetota bacterium]|nr:hypothetical protein [Planctomycetota bacterium]
MKERTILKNKRPHGLCMQMPFSNLHWKKAGQKAEKLQRALRT